jgi:hypothetical protein
MPRLNLDLFADLVGLFLNPNFQAAHPPTAPSMWTLMA